MGATVRQPDMTDYKLIDTFFYTRLLSLNDKGARDIVRKMGILFLQTKLLPANVELFANINRSV
jgi:hypothetical protein